MFEGAEAQEMNALELVDSALKRIEKCRKELAALDHETPRLTGASGESNYASTDSR